jgi:O-antigen/teichoic acid export membrane protein
MSPRLFDAPLLRAMLRYSLPMVPTALFFWVIALSDRFFLAHYRDATEVGLYSIGVAIGAVLTLVTGAFQNAWAAFAFSIKDQSDAKQTYALAMEGYLYVSCALGLGLALFAPEALRILTPARYHAAENVVAPLAIGYVMAGLCQITQIGAMLVKRTRAVFEAFGIAALANLALNVLLIPRYGRAGAAYATLLSQAVLPFHLLWRSQRLYYIPFRSWLTVAVPGATLLIAVMMRGAVDGLPLVAAIGAKLLVVVSFAALLVLTSPVRGWVFERVRLASARET